VNHLGHGNPKVDVALVSERTDPNVFHGFTRFREIAGPRVNPAIGFTPDVYGIGEAWLRFPGDPEVYRAQAHPARRPASGDFAASAGSIQAQDSSGTWSPVFATGSANKGNESDDPAVGGLTVPQALLLLAGGTKLLLRKVPVRLLVPKYACGKYFTRHANGAIFCD
jgi:hypothetical protein